MIEPSLIDEAQVAVVVADDDRRYVHANAAACDLLAVSREELIGMRIEEITGTPAEQSVQAWMRFREAGVMVGTFPIPSPVGARNVPFISIADVSPGRHLAVFLPERWERDWQPLSQREREVVEAVAGRLEVLVDGGVRRGADVVKALALGAQAVLVGRPVLWGLAAGGEAGALRVLDLLRQEIELDDVGV